MKKTLRLLALLPLVFFSCGDDDSGTVDPFLGKWELFNASRDIVETDFEYLEFSNSSNLYGEDLYTIEFSVDETFVRVLEGTASNIEENGTWDLDEDGDLFLTVETPIDGLDYEMRRTEVSESDLQFIISETGLAYPQSKIIEWIDDGLVDSQTLSFTDAVDETQIDSLNGFLQTVIANYTLNFDKATN